MTAEKRPQNQIDQNYAAFNGRDAQLAGGKLFADGVFSVQAVRDRALDLGWFSHAVPQRTVRP